jgi:DNA replication and repair protein RecF
MHLQKLHLVQFKNYKELILSLSPEINCFIGENGSGKTNLLDAIHYLCMTKSAFGYADIETVQKGTDFFAVNGIFEHETEEKNSCLIQCSYNKTDSKKLIRADKVPYKRLSEHIGRFPVVLIEPDDNDLVREGSETRRRFFDATMCQMSNIYLENLVAYNHQLQQRNKLLKYFADNHTFDANWLAAYDQPLLELGKKIFEERKKFIAAFDKPFQDYYNYLTGSKEKVQLRYESDWQQENFEQIFYQTQTEDRLAQRTLKGVHKDDFIFELNELPLKKNGSQGQKKSYVIALKLTNFYFIVQKTKKNPILLLDDIFDKLDDLRIHQLIEIVASQQVGQVFMTDARPERTKQFLSQMTQKNKFIFDVANRKKI